MPILALVSEVEEEADIVAEAEEVDLATDMATTFAISSVIVVVMLDSIAGIDLMPPRIPMVADV